MSECLQCIATAVVAGVAAFLLLCCVADLLAWRWHGPGYRAFAIALALGCVGVLYGLWIWA